MSATIKQPSRATRVRLGDVLRLRKEIVHPRDNPSGPAVFVGLEHIESGTGRRIGQLEVEKSSLSGRKPVFKKGDLVYGYLRPYLNKVWVADFEGLCSVDQYVYSVDTEAADPRFIAWFLRSPVFLGRAPIASSPGQLPRIRTEEVAAVQLDLPGLADQHRILELLSAQMTEAERARAAAEARLEAANKLRDTILAQAFHADLGWRKRSLEDLADSENAFADGPFGSNLKTEHYATSGARVIRLQNIGRGEILDSDKTYVSFEHYRGLARHGVESNDVIVAALGSGARPAGRACLIPDGFGLGLVKADCFRVRLPAETIDPLFLVYWLNSRENLDRVADCLRGATRPRFTLGMLRSTLVPVPPLDQQKKTVADVSKRLQAAQACRAQAEEGLRLIRGLPGALLRQTFSGDL